MTKSILVVEDDEFFREVVKDVLTKSGFKVTLATDGRNAKLIMNLSSFDLVLSDIQMPHMTGVELLSWIIENKPNVPVILMTGFAHILETKNASELGAAGFLPKPFSDKEAIQLINDLLGSSESQQSTTESQSKTTATTEAAGYGKISIDDFVIGKVIPFAIFVRFSGGKFIKLAHKGEDISLAKIKLFKEKGIEHLYLKKEDLQALVRMNLGLMRGIQAKSNYPEELKQKLTRYAGEVLLEQVFIVGLNQEAFESAKDYVSSLIDVMASDDDLYDVISCLNTHSDYLYAHCLAVSTYAVMIAKAQGWNSANNLYKLSMAGLFHDIGKKEIDREILEKPRYKLTAEERKVYESHPLRGKEILEAMTKIPTEVINVALEHHEDQRGMGYPRRLDKNLIHPFSKIVSAANIFSNYVLRSPFSSGISPTEAIAQIEARDVDKIDLQCLEALRKIINKTNPK